MPGKTVLKRENRLCQQAIVMTGLNEPDSRPIDGIGTHGTRTSHTCHGQTPHTSQTDSTHITDGLHTSRMDYTRHQSAAFLRDCGHRTHQLPNSRCSLPTTPHDSTRFLSSRKTYPDVLTTNTAGFNLPIISAASSKAVNIKRSLNDVYLSTITCVLTRFYLAAVNDPAMRSIS